MMMNDTANMGSIFGPAYRAQLEQMAGPAVERTARKSAAPQPSPSQGNVFVSFAKALMAVARWYVFLCVYLFSRGTNALNLLAHPKHQDNVVRSRELLAQLRKLSGTGHNARCMEILRGLNPYLFEELVLTALEESRKGIFVVRGTRYSGDGGIDGSFWKFGVFGRFGVQSKCYSDHIKAKQVQDFARALKRAGLTQGLFVHSGTTTDATFAGFGLNNVTPVSSLRLTQLILSGTLPDSLN